MSVSDAIRKIRDPVRGSFIVDTPEQIGPLFASINAQVLAAGGKWVSVKNFFADQEQLELGYAGINTRFLMPLLPKNPPTGCAQTATEKKYITIELQFHFRKIMDGTKDSAKEVAHHIYEIPRETGEEISPKIISSSQLVYLTAMAKLVASEHDLEAYENAVQNLESMSKVDKIIRLWMETSLLLHKTDLSLADWNGRLQVLVPRNGKAVADEWIKTAKKINARIHLPPIKVDNSEPCTNTATSLEELEADADEIAPVFEDMCKRAVADKDNTGCSYNFGPDNACIKKSRKSLLAKIKKIRDDELKKVLSQLLLKIGRSWFQVAGSNSVPFKNFSELKRLDFSGCGALTDHDLAFLRELPALQHVDLSNCNQLTDATLAHLDGLCELESLDLSNGSFTDQGLMYLARRSKLKCINVSGCQGISKNGVRGLLQSVQQNPASPNPNQESSSSSQPTNTVRRVSEEMKYPPASETPRPPNLQTRIRALSFSSSISVLIEEAEKWKVLLEKDWEQGRENASLWGESAILYTQKPDFTKLPPDKQAQVLHFLGILKEEQADLRAAMAYHLRALDLRQETDKANSLDRLGTCSYRLNKIAEASNYYQQADAIRNQNGKQTPLDQAHSLIHDAMRLYHKGDIEKALTNCQYALKIQVRELGEQSREVSKTYFEMGQCEEVQGNNAAAYNHYKKSHDIAKNLFKDTDQHMKDLRMKLNMFAKFENKDSH